MPGTNEQTEYLVGFARRLAIIVYDSLLLMALLFIAMVPSGGMTIAPHSLMANLVLLYLLAVGFVFYGWFWTHGGQTLGMKTWKVQLLRNDGALPTWKDAFIRYMVAVLTLGLGLFASLLHPQRLALHDIASHTHLVRVPTQKT